jgi:hypothetical protein
MAAASQAGIPGSLVDSRENAGFDCSVSFDHKDAQGRFLERSMLFLTYVRDFAEEPCGNPSTGTSCLETSFHGYPAADFTFGDQDAGRTLAWNMPRGGDHYRMGVHVGFSGVAPEAYAEALWSVAEDQLPVSGPPSGGVENPVPPESPTEPETPINTGGLFDVPLPILLANLGIPAAGALTGAVLSALMGARPGAGAQKDIEGPPWVPLEALKSDLEEIDRQLKASGYYVTNKLQADPILIGHGLEEIVNFGSDVVTGSTGATCHDYVSAVDARVLKAVQNRFPGARVEKRRFVELSTLNAEQKLADAGEMLDAVVDDGHILHKAVVNPNTAQEATYSIDFHGHNAKLVGEAPPILRPYAEPVAEWTKYLGLDQFRDIEYVDKVQAPQ